MTLLKLLFALLLIGSAQAQTMVKAPLDAKPGNADCAPGHYGTQWPGSVYREAVNGNSGWYAYAWCMNDAGLPVYVARLCATDECLSMDQVFATVGRLISSALGTDPRTVARSYTASNPLAYHCSIYPPGATPPVLSAAETALIPATDTPRGRACAELLALMQRDWPMLEFAAPTPNPGPPGLWTAGGGTIFTFKAGKLTGLTNRKSVPGAPCDCSVTTTVKTTTYCSLGVATEVAVCVK